MLSSCHDSHSAESANFRGSRCVYHFTNCPYHLKDRSIRNYGFLLPHSPSVLYPFYPIHPVSYPLIISPLLNFLIKHLSSSPPSWVVDWFWWLVWLSGLCSFYSCFVFLCRFYGWLVLLCFGFIGSVGLVWVCFLLSFFYPIHPVSFPLSFTQPLNFLIKPLSSSPLSWVVDRF